MTVVVLGWDALDDRLLHRWSMNEAFGGHVDVERRRVCPGGDPRA